VIYTSGSTGRPKGVAVEQRNVVQMVYWARSAFSDRELGGVLASTSISFDLSIFELFVPLCWGGRVILAENALDLPRLPAAGEVVLVNTIPSVMAELLRIGGLPSSVETVALAGEPLPSALADQVWASGSVRRVLDLYGPTEDTVYSTLAERKPGAPATIGRPHPNKRAYLLDPLGQLVPIGVPGELHLAGEGLARGYLNRPELTAERFIANPFGPGRLYRTGDLARYREDGHLEYLGRLDRQVKLRGFRIELAEIETALRKHPSVLDVVVVPRNSPAGEMQLAAFYTAREPLPEAGAL
jgi:amino acid adenylation domain-containing protein